MLMKQSTKMERDFAAVKDVQVHGDQTTSEPTGVDESTFKYAWMLVNSRTFYWDYPTALPEKRNPRARQKSKLLPRDDCMALCPFIDYFNHSNEGVSALTCNKFHS